MDEVIVIAICLLLNALLAAYEMAFVSAPRSELRSLARKGNKVAQRVSSLRENPERTLSIIQIGISLVGAIAAAVGGAGAAENLEPYFIQTLGLREIHAELLSVLLVVLPITYLSVVVGELVPKTLALRSPMKILFSGARALFVADRLLSPLITILEWSTKKILSIFFKDHKKKADPAAQPAIEIDSLSPVHQSFMLNMAEIEKQKVGEIFLPWEHVISVKDSDSLEDVMRVVLTSGHTRLPVTNNGEVVGILHTKEFLALRESGESQWQSIIRQAIKVLVTDSALRALRTMQERRSHMAIVFSHEGSPLGLITMEDVLEEVIGDVYDEDDDGRVLRILARKGRSRIMTPS